MLLSAALIWGATAWMGFHHQPALRPGHPADLIVVLDGGAARLARADAFRQLLHPQPSEQLLIRCPHAPPVLQLMPELLQGYDTASQITALALWLRERHSPPPRRIWIATDPEHTARATLLARIALAGRGIEIQPDTPPPPPPSERHKLVRDALRLVLWRATGSTGGVWGVGLQLLADPRGACSHSLQPGTPNGVTHMGGRRPKLRDAWRGAQACGLVSAAQFTPEALAGDAFSGQPLLARPLSSATAFSWPRRCW